MTLLAKTPFALNASRVWFEHKQRAGTRQRRRSFCWLGGGCQVSFLFEEVWNSSHSCSQILKCSKQQSTLNSNLILKLQKKINSEWKFTQICVIADVFCEAEFEETAWTGQYYNNTLLNCFFHLLSQKGVEHRSCVAFEHIEINHLWI